MSKAQLRQAVLRDLGALLNAVQPLGAAGQADRASPTACSTSGCRRCPGQLASKLDVSVLERSIRQAIVRFEPRILSESLVVRALEATTVLDTHNVIEFEIRGHLWSQPVPLEILLRTQLDLEAGQVEVRDAVGRGALAGKTLAAARHGPRLLRLYSDELAHLREVGAEFAREFPKIAARLGMEGMEVTDPYVERLLEGFAFLAARVQLKLEAEQPG